MDWINVARADTTSNFTARLYAVIDSACYYMYPAVYTLHLDCQKPRQKKYPMS